MKLQGTTLNNTVFLGKFVGEGAAGEVYLGKMVKAIATLKIGDSVAVKVYKPQILDYPNQKERINREFKVGASISHPNLVKIYHVDSYKIDNIDRPYLLMEYIKGMSLREYIKNNYPLTDTKLVDYFKQLFRGVSCLHKNKLLHRDIKPDNIMVSNNDRIILMDLGVVKDLMKSNITSSDQFLGTIRYAAPEYLFDLKASEESDAYSCGAILYFMIYSHDVFSSEKLFSNVILKISSKNPTFGSPKRYSSKKLVLLLEIARRLLHKEGHKRITLNSSINEIESLYSGKLWNEYIFQLVRYRIANIWQRRIFKNLPQFPEEPNNLIPSYLFVIPPEFYKTIFSDLTDADWVKYYADENVESSLKQIKSANKLIALDAIEIDLVEWKNRFISTIDTTEKVGLLRSLLLKYIIGAGDDIEQTLKWVENQTDNNEVLSFCHECLLFYGSLEIIFTECA